MSLSRIFIVFFLFVHFQASAVEIKKSDVDNRIYHYQVLDNQLKVLLISDPRADKAAASLNVDVGSYDDPVDREGLAHFLEHMLFLGTKKYPEADEYQNFISNSGGSHNAYTSSHNTNYFFDVDNEKLDAALDRFSQFFVAPLFDAFYVDRERNAVHSEYQARIQDDYRRSYDVYRSVVNPKHPHAKFNVGSLETLADRPNDLVRDDLLTFYEQHYSSEKMSLVVLGNYSIADLKAMVEERFRAVPLKATSKQNAPTDIPLFEQDKLPMEVLIKPLKELRQMSMNFTLPSVAKYYKEKPLDFIAYILGHEGKGSLLSLLKQQGLAEGLSAGGYDQQDGSAAFYVNIQLTQKGVEQRDQVRALVFYAIKQIKEKSIEEWRYEEKKLLSKMAFRFREIPEAIDTVKHLSSNLALYPPEEVISGDYLLENFNKDLIVEMLDFLKPENVFVSTSFPEVDADKKTEFYNTPYIVNSLSTTDMDKAISALPQTLVQAFVLPEKNPFIPKSLSLFEKDEALSKPIQIFGEKNDIWARQDLSYGIPKAKVKFRIFSPVVAGSLKGSAKVDLYERVLRDRLNEFSYPALLAGASIEVEANNRGMDITVQGYHDSLLPLMQVLMAEIDGAQVDPKRFDQLKQELVREWRNDTKKTPYHQLYNQLAVDLYKPYWSDASKIDALEGVSRENLIDFAKTWRVGATLKGLFYGNFDQSWLERWDGVLTLAQEQKKDKSIVAATTVLKLDKTPSQYDVKAVDHTDSAIALYIQGSDDSLQSQSNMMLLRQLLQSPFYSSLRTEQQLGYIVFMGSLQLREVPGSVFVVQSPTASVDEMRTAITTFIDQFSKQIPDDIATYKSAVITQLLEKPTSLFASANDYWSSLVRDNTQFNYRQQLAYTVNGTSSEQLKAAYRDVVANKARHLWIYSKTPEKTEGQTRFSDQGEVYVYP